MTKRMRFPTFKHSWREGGELHRPRPVCAAGNHKKGYQKGIRMDVGAIYGRNHLMHKANCVYRARKLMNLRVFEDPTSGKGWEKSVSDLGLEILCVSQVSSSWCFPLHHSSVLLTILCNFCVFPVYPLPYSQRQQARLPRCPDR